MTLLELVNNERTDKNTIHSYLSVYESLFQSKKETAKQVLEIGIDNGGSIKMWSYYFKNAKVHAMDIKKYDDILDELKNKDNIILHSHNAYDLIYFVDKFLNPGLKFDIMIDDGPHTLESMILFLNMFIL